MGGMGSGCNYHWWRSGKKTTVEDCLQLDANRWSREGVLKAGLRQTGGWSWYRDGERKEITSSIGYEVNTLADPPWVRLFFAFTQTGEQVDYRIALATTQPRFGGLRWWFICPLVVNGRPCGRRVCKLYLPPGSRYFGCRHCHDLTYTSRQESHKADCLARFMAAQNGWDFAEVKRIINRLGKG